MLGYFSQENANAIPPIQTRQVMNQRANMSGQLFSPICGCNNCRNTSDYGPRWGRLHAGQDIACVTGFPIRASASGVVNFAGWRGGYGNRVEILKSSLVTLASGGSYMPEQIIETSYSHLSRIAVSRGTRVQAGDVIGYCGATGGGDITGSHLHYEVRVGTQRAPIDPQNFFQGDIQRYCPGQPDGSPVGVEV